MRWITKVFLVYIWKTISYFSSEIVRFHFYSYYSYCLVNEFEWESIFCTNFIWNLSDNKRRFVDLIIHSFIHINGIRQLFACLDILKRLIKIYTKNDRDKVYRVSLRLYPLKCRLSFGAGTKVSHRIITIQLNHQSQTVECFNQK